MSSEWQLWVSVLSPTLTLVLTLAGWIFVYRNTNRIAKRAEVFTLVSKGVDKVVALDRRCADYWLGAKNPPEPAGGWIAGTSSEIYGLRSIFELLEKYHGFEGKDTYLSNLRSSATLDAEDVSTLSIDVLYERRSAQVAAVSDALTNLYSYYRASQD
ncbi:MULTISPECIES: hypothetical protein [Pseudomonas syringae group]|uniref:hypothetical protein n=1 Tax=Pseudomonas syringae group TaxID=136849 RepID=UPI0013CEBCFC|nr:MULTISPECIES: hypothetical protein [Pseudomonas syringae group]MCF9000525.1 hypothetical protein [Pseudomonas syringae]